MSIQNENNGNEKNNLLKSDKFQQNHQLIQFLYLNFILTTKLLFPCIHPRQCHVKVHFLDKMKKIQ